MARGWESKSVEQQQADMMDKAKSRGPLRSPAQQKLDREREGLLLARKRLTDQLRSSTRPQHRQMLEQSIAEVDRQLSCFEQITGPRALK